MKKALAFFYKQFGHLLMEGRTPDSHGICMTCGQANIGLFAHGKDRLHCAPCQSFYVSSPKLGIQNYRGAGIAKYYSLGMMPSCGLLVMASKVQLFVPEVVYEKIKANDLTRECGLSVSTFDTVNGKSGLIRQLILETPNAPYLLITDLGKQQERLIKSLKLNDSPNHLWVNEAGVLKYLDADAIRRSLTDHPDNDDGVAITLLDIGLSALRKGALSLDDRKLTLRLVNQKPQWKQWIKQLPADPYSREQAFKFVLDDFKGATA